MSLCDDSRCYDNVSATSKKLYFVYKRATGKDPWILDAPVSPTGQKQIEELAKSVDSLQPFPQLVVTSPLTRTLQTAAGVFGGRAPIVVCDLLRERFRESADVGRPPSELAAHFQHLPGLAAELERLPALWWAHQGRALPDVAESAEAFAERCREALRWIWERPEDVIAVVAHSQARPSAARA
eukprot:tig00000553_g2125.t1